MDTPIKFKLLQEFLKRHYSAILFRTDAPNTPVGLWFLDISIPNPHTPNTRVGMSIAFHPVEDSFGFDNANTETFYGEGPENTEADTTIAYGKIVEILTTKALLSDPHKLLKQVINQHH